MNKTMLSNTWLRLNVNASKCTIRDTHELSIKRHMLCACMPAIVFVVSET